MTATTNQTLLVTLTTIVGLIVLVALKDITAVTALPLIGTLAGVHLGANVVPTTPAVTAQVTPVARIQSPPNA